MKNLITSALLYLILYPSIAQTTYTSDQMLVKTCQVWGYVKYFHSNVNSCSIDWDSVLIAHLPAIKNASSDDIFNSEIQSIINAAGEMEIPVTPSDEPVEPFLNNLDFFWIDDLVFDDAVKSSLDTIRARYRSKDNCYVVLNDYADPEDIGWLKFTNENNDIPSPSYPDEEYRLLILFRYWNIINYFHAYRDLYDIPWDISLESAIPQIINAANELDYLKALRKLIAKTYDAHSIFSDNDFVQQFFGGQYYPALWFGRIEDQAVVVDSWLPGEELKPGDIIHAINGIPIETLTDSLGAFRPHCTDASWYRDVYLSMLLGPEGSEMVFDAENETGNFTVTIERTENVTAFSNQLYYLTDKYETYEITECGYGYVNMGELATSDINSMYNALEETPVIIFDIRNYPNGTVWNLVKKLMGSQEVSAILNQPDPLYPGTFIDPPFYEMSGIEGHEPYAGKIYILCNEFTQSQAEYSIMKLQSFPDHKVIGSQTAGADGNVSIIFLPDSLETWFTALEVLYPDSSQTQRIGVQIDTIVKPTIAGLRAGVDEVLEAALDCVTGITNVHGDSDWNIFPNPAQQTITINIPASDAKTNRITISNLEGEIVLDKSDVHDQKILFVTNLPVGLYLVSLFNDDLLAGTQKLIISR